MTEVVRYYVSAAYIDHPIRSDKRFGYAGIGLYCPILRNLNYRYKILELEDCRANMQTPLRAKLWAVVKGMEALIKFLKDHPIDDVDFILICDDLTTVDLILDYGPSYMCNYGNDPSNWRNSKGLPLQDAHLIYKAMALNQTLECRCGLQSFELTYQRKGFGKTGPSRAWSLAQEAADNEEKSSNW